MADYMLETVSYAARLSKSYMLPVGAPPEEQAAQSATWNAVDVYAAMLSSLEYLCHLMSSWRAVSVGFRYWMHHLSLIVSTLCRNSRR
ncbi:TraI domain-containing protein [Enterobacteriaceae bacterium H11S18]|uniref:TraI domain-containing protein n=1 Tax=Dryocola clanedunensis TaxID=2925396 RepID=UPI0022F008B9|nr:TraI domain-containing protein [Dryocola clanedunensis]MCT4708710.1 TraI domain-containing protein [Dryocola clanedunensis]